MLSREKCKNSSGREWTRLFLTASRGTDDDGESVGIDLLGDASPELCDGKGIM